MIIETVNRAVWGAPLIILILGMGLCLSICTGWVQITLLPRAVREFCRTLHKGKNRNGVSSFQALCTALGATVGTGNLIGVAGAICLGGPGAVFWMWICGLLGMAVKFSEATLAVYFRVKKDKEYLGGPMYMIQQGMGEKYRPLASLYCFFGIIAAFGVGNATQIHAVITGIRQVMISFHLLVPENGNLILGIGLAFSIGMLLKGGARRIGRAAERLVPVVSGGYILLGLWALIAGRAALPGAFHSIFLGAFSPEAVTGGTIGSLFGSMTVGIRRGVFTNEAGMGTASIAHAGAEVSHPAEQGLMGMMEVFIDTILICTLTALVILTSGVPIPYGIDAGGDLTMDAFSAVCGKWVTVFLAICLCCFALATVIGWGLYGIRCARFLFGPEAVRIFIWLQMGTAVISVRLGTGVIWSLAEIFNGLMAVPNLIALAALSPQVRQLTADYRKKKEKAHTEGGTYENLDQCKSVRTVPHAKISSHGCGG